MVKKKTMFKKTNEKICYVKYKYKIKKYQKNGYFYDTLKSAEALNILVENRSSRRFVGCRVFISFLIKPKIKARIFY